MYINVETTPNPNTLQFILGKAILPENKTYNFNNNGTKTISPLANELFSIEDIVGLFMNTDFITVSIKDADDWDILKPLIISHITEFFSSGTPVVLEGDKTDDESEDIVFDDKDKEIVGKISDLFSERIRPAVAMDGGDIIFKQYQEGRVYIKMFGSCSGCPSSTITLKSGIENMLKYYVPEVDEVIDIDEEVNSF